MHDFSLRSPLIRLPLLSLTTIGLTSIGLCSMMSSTLASTPRSVTYSETRIRTEHYYDCATTLLEAGIGDSDAAAACAAALYPRDLSRCVDQIDQGTEILATDALSGCRRVRRPLELATCVTEIDGGTTGAEPLVVLDNCRRSLLPTRFSACVVGLTQGIQALPPVNAMQTCIASGTRPRNVLPTFVPADQPPPVTPGSVN